MNQFHSRDLNAPINGVRPDVLFGRIAQVESSGTLTENSLEIKAEGTIFKGVTFDSRYKLTKADNDFDRIFDLPMNNYDMSIEKGASNLNRRHQLTGNFNFLLFNRLQVTPIFRFESPLPFTITTGRDNDDDTVFNDRPIGFKRNSECGEWFEQVDLRLGWRIPISKREKSNKDGAKDFKNVPMNFLKNHSIGIDVTIQNLFNHTNLQNFVGNQLSPFYQQATSAAPARQIQIGLNFFL